MVTVVLIRTGYSVSQATRNFGGITADQTADFMLVGKRRAFRSFRRR